MNEKPYYINVKGTLVEVTKEVYLAYYRSKRRDRYFEHDIKTETAIYDKGGHITGYRPSKEDSLDRMLETGADFAGDCKSVEDAIVSSLMSDKLHDILRLLTEDERKLIEALFFSNNGNGMTEREYARKIGILQQTIHARKRVILAKLKKLLEKQK